jgi:Putative adhesin
MRRVALVGFLAACGGRAVTLSHPDLEAEAFRTEVVDVAAAEGLLLDLATPAGDVTIEVFNGPPQLVAKMRLVARTEAEAERLLDGFSVAARRVEGALVVRLEGEPAEVPGTEILVRPLLSFSARVPPGQRLRAESGTGDVEVKGAAGDCSLVAAFGDLKVLGTRGAHLSARTSSGTVQVEDAIAESIEIDSAFGEVRLVNVRGDLDVQAGSGDVAVKGFSGRRCELQTGFGDIDARGTFLELTAKTSSGRVGVLAEPGSTIEAPWTLRSSFGDVELRVPRDFDCNVFAETSFGSVTSDVNLRERGKRSDRRVSGEIGEGGGRITLQTSSGDVRIRAQ